MIVLCPRPPNWVEVHTNSARLLTSVKFGVKAGFKTYDPDKRVWLIHTNWLAWLVHLARSQQHDVDYTALPESWQLRAAGAQVLVDHPIVEENPFVKLHLRDDAPIEVVHAAYKALAFLHHPDKGGAVGKFQEIVAAYEKIIRIRGC